MESRLFKECIEALAPGVEILPKSDSEKLWALFKKMLPIAFWGRIDWDKISQKNCIDSVGEIIPTLADFLQRDPSPMIYIFWNDASLPVVKAKLPVAIKFIDDITCVGPDTWFLNIEDGYVIEFFHEGEILIGRVPTITEREIKT